MVCDDCGKVLEIGDFPFCPHGKGHGMLGYFKAYTDYHISDTPVHITSLGQKKQLLKPRWENDHLVQLQPRDLPDSHYRELNDRREARRAAATKAAK